MVKVISLPYICPVLYVLCLIRPRYQVSVYRTIGPLVVLKHKKCTLNLFFVVVVVVFVFHFGKTRNN